jgi:two-component system phosphate regulon sensor histidine kinase PhoR
MTTFMAAGFKEKTRHQQPDASNAKASAIQLERFIKTRFEKVGLKMDFTVAIYNTRDNNFVLGSKNYARLSPPDFSIPLEGFLPFQCNCPLSLNLQHKNLIQYFLVESKNIYLPALLFTFLLLVGGIGAFVVYEKVQFQAKSKQDFFNFLTHELKTPVFTISIASKIIENYRLDEKALEALQIIKTENNKLKVQIEKILEMVVADKSLPELEKVELNVPDFFLTVINDFRTQISHDDTISFSHQVEESIRYIRGDKHYLYHVFLNLLENAKKFKTGNVKINFNVHYISNQVHIEVKDNGWGIENRFQQLIFTPFFRIKQEGNVPGYGLGLSYCKKMIKLHHGKLTLFSVVGKGSLFTVILPLVKE